MTPPARRRGSTKRTLLIVDDMPLVRRSLRDSLRGEYRVWTSASAEEALDRLEALGALDAILIDVQLPGMNGLELAERVRVNRPNLKVFLMTANDLDTTAHEAFLVKADGYLRMPFDLETIREMLASRLISTTS